MGALALNQLLESAQDKQVDLVLETAKVENARLLEEVERMSLDAIPKQQRRGVGELTSIKDEAKVLCLFPYFIQRNHDLRLYGKVPVGWRSKTSCS